MKKNDWILKDGEYPVSYTHLDVYKRQVQVASRFVATEECDASDAYKHAYLNANESYVQIIQSPVGMPGRAVRNEFIRGLEKEKMCIRDRII